MIENSTGPRTLPDIIIEGSLTTKRINLPNVQNTIFNPIQVTGNIRENNAAKNSSLASNVLSQSATKSLQTLISFPKSLIVDNKRTPINIVPGIKRQRKASEGHIQTNSIQKYLVKLT